MGELMVVWVDGRMGWMDGWMDGWVGRYRERITAYGAPDLARDLSNGTKWLKVHMPGFMRPI